MAAGSVCHLCPQNCRGPGTTAICHGHPGGRPFPIPLPGRQKGPPSRGNFSFRSPVPYMVLCFSASNRSRLPAPSPLSPHLHPPRSLGASDQFWCSGGSRVTPCGGRQDPSVSPTLCPLKAASRCPWRHRVKKSWPQQRPGIGLPGGRAQLLPARHTCTHSMAKGAGGTCPPHTGRRANPRPGFRGSRAGTEESGHVGDSHLTPGGVCAQEHASRCSDQGKRVGVPGGWPGLTCG